MGAAADAGDGEYEAHMTKADGTEVTVKLDTSFAVIGVEDGMGKGDPSPAVARGGGAGGTPFQRRRRAAPWRTRARTGARRTYAAFVTTRARALGAVLTLATTAGLASGTLLPAASAAPVPPGVTATANASGATAWKTTAPVVVTARGATLFAVRLVPVGTTAAVPGGVDATRHRWTTSVELRPGTTYQLVVSVAVAAPVPTPAPPTPEPPAPSTVPDPAAPVIDPVTGLPVEAPPAPTPAPVPSIPVAPAPVTPPSVVGAQALVTTFRTGAATRVVRAVIATPAARSLVGVGMPVVVRFTSPVTDRASVVRALTVRTSRPVGPAAWHWVSATEVHYRPKSYWPARTTITVQAALAGVHAAPGTWGVEGRSLTFSTGRSQILKITNSTHRMAVVVDGRVVRTLPVSMGKPGFATRSGIKVLTAKYLSVRMRSTSIGIPAGSTESYDLTVPYAMQITSSGEYIHGAPWNPVIGYANRSHGCTNLRLADARWLYGAMLPGDPVETVGTGRAMEPRNGLGGDWNVPWAVWSVG